MAFRMLPSGDYIYFQKVHGNNCYFCRVEERCLLKVSVGLIFEKRFFIIMRYLFRLIVYIIIFFITFSVGYVTLMRFVPVTITPLKIIRFFEGHPEKGRKIYSEWIPLKGISVPMQKAVIATEDNNFFKHNGFDFEAIKKAVEENKKGKRVLGASTISQQTAKNVFCRPSRTWWRKGFESYYTVLIEALWSKRRIMEVYLNIIEVHPNIYGVGAAAQYFYNKEAVDLNAHEASMIATVLPNPLRMNIGKPSSYMVRRSEQVRKLMRLVAEPDYTVGKKDK